MPFPFGVRIAELEGWGEQGTTWIQANKRTLIHVLLRRRNICVQPSWLGLRTEHIELLNSAWFSAVYTGPDPPLGSISSSGCGGWQFYQPETGCTQGVQTHCGAFYQAHVKPALRDHTRYTLLCSGETQASKNLRFKQQLISLDFNFVSC